MPLGSDAARRAGRRVRHGADGRRSIFTLDAVMLGGWAFVVFPLIDAGEFRWKCNAIGAGQPSPWRRRLPG